MPEEIYSYTVLKEDTGKRLDKFLAQHLEGAQVSRSKISQCIKSGRVLVDGVLCKRPGTRLYAGQQLRLHIADLQKSRLQPEKGELDILYEDQDLLVLNKPAGLNVHPAESSPEKTLVHRLLHEFPHLQGLDDLRPGIVHRLDKDTSGLMLVALNENCRQRLSQSFAERRIKKTYLALVLKVPEPGSGTIDMPLGRDPKKKIKMAVLPQEGREAISEYELIWSSPDKNFSLLKVKIQTGRTHQIRVHLAYLGYPLLGDKIYASGANKETGRQLPRIKALTKRQMLHAWQLGFTHPLSDQQLNFTQAVPRDFWRVLLALAQKRQLVGLTGMPGCGKSLLLQILKEMGVRTWSADQAVQELYQFGGDGWEVLRRRFGTRFLQNEHGPVDKAKLFQAMQKSANVRKEVMQAIHPLVRHNLDEFVNQNRDQRLLVAEVPLLVESGWQASFDLVLGVYCPAKWRKKWLRQSRGWDGGLLSNVESWQLSEKEKLQSCQLLLVNPGTRPGLQERAAKLLKVLSFLRRNNMHHFMDWLANLGIHAS